MSVPWSRWKPRLLDTIPQYSTSDLVPDLVAGVTVGLVALPLAMAFGIASGTTPQAGIYTAIIGGLLVSVFGGSRIQIGGPTGAFVVVVAAIIAEHGISGLYICGALPQPSQMLQRAEFVEHVGEDNILPHINAALERAAIVFSSSSRSASASAPSGHAAGSRPDRTPRTPVIR